MVEMHPKYTVIAAIITAITFVSSFTYLLAGFFLKEEYDKQIEKAPDNNTRCLWIEAKEKFKIYFQFIDDGNTELVMNGTFGIFVLLFLGEQETSIQRGVTGLFVLLKLVINYRGHEIVTNYWYDCGRICIWHRTRGRREKVWFVIFYFYLIGLLFIPFALLPVSPELPFCYPQPAHHVALFIVILHILFWILAAEVWRPGDTLAKAKGL